MTEEDKQRKYTEGFQISVDFFPGKQHSNSYIIQFAWFSEKIDTVREMVIGNVGQTKAAVHCSRKIISGVFKQCNNFSKNLDTLFHYLIKLFLIDVFFARNILLNFPQGLN